MDIVDLRDIIDNREDDLETYEMCRQVILDATGHTLETVIDHDPFLLREEELLFADDARDYTVVVVDGVRYYCWRGANTTKT